MGGQKKQKNKCCYMIYLDDIMEGWGMRGMGGRGVQCHVKLGLKKQCFTTPGKGELEMKDEDWLRNGKSGTNAPLF